MGTTTHYGWDTPVQGTLNYAKLDTTLNAIDAKVFTIEAELGIVDPTTIAANLFLGGPVSGANAAPAYRTIQRPDLITAGLAITAAKTLTVTENLTLSGATGNNLTLTKNLTVQGANLVLNATTNADVLTIPALVGAADSVAVLKTANVFTAANTFASVKAAGTAGAGYHESVDQSSAPTAPASGWRLYSDASHRFSWIGQNGFVRTFDGTANTADRIYTLPDAAGAVVLDTATQTLTNKTLTTPTIGNFTNATHDHTNAAGGGTLTSTAISDFTSAVQSLLNTMDVKQECAYATAAALASNTYANGSSGVGATLTGTANGPLTVDGILLTTGQRILVKNEATAANNGVYVVTQVGVALVSPYILTRATDSDQATELGPGYLVPVEGPTGSLGVVNNGTLWISLAPSPFVVGTSGITFSQQDASGALLKANNLSDLANTVTAQANLFGNQTANTVYAGPTSGGAAASAFRALVAADIPNHSAALITSGTLAITQGGTGQATALTAFNALSPLTARGDLLTRDASNNVRLAVGAANRVLRSDGTDPSWGQVVLTTDVSGTLPLGNGGTGQTTAAAAFDALSGMTTLGDVLYGGASGTRTRLAGNTTAVKQYLSQTGNGSISAAPAWATLDAGDIGGGTLAAARGGTGVSNAGTLTNASNTTITGGGTLALGGFTLTAPATGTAALATGLAGGQTITGGTASGENLTLTSTSHATKGKIFFGAGATSAYDGVNDRIGIGTASPSVMLELSGTGALFQGSRVASSTSAAACTLRKANTSTTAVASGDQIGSFNFSGHDGTNYVLTAAVRSLCDGTVSTNVVPQAIVFYSGSSSTLTERARFSSLGSFIVGAAALATNATDGFLYIPTCAGTPTGTPTTFTGRSAIIFDTTNDKLYVYRGSWKSVTLA